MNRKLFIFITGQYRKFWHSWNNLVEKVIRVNDHHMDVCVCVGMDEVYSPNRMWADDERHIFEKHIRGEWELLGYKSGNLILEWVSRENTHLQKGVSSLRKYTPTPLTPGWFDYLVARSGSCIEYAQFAQLYDKVISQYEIGDDDMLMRTRTDILLRHPISFHSIPHDTRTPTKNVFGDLIVGTTHFEQFQEPPGREASIFPAEPEQHKWAITLRKNLIYIIPMKAANLLVDVATRYGDWDTPENNAYWFNAESQFRGCLRLNNFTVWEYSQDKDQCGNGFEDLAADLPIYAIYR